ncbi:hypothetical protein ACNRWW_05365 [Metabacillus sp. HB246100]|uniref:hypothetical protein n=1 Tax=Bacillus weihaiensis TaxID=1547283 RepID=UPI002353AF56|nr:hypothetical protein [Bacillus weihaiensis]
MGYILPIQNDTYTQYVNRSMPVQSHYSHILPVTYAQRAESKNHQPNDESDSHFATILKKKLNNSNSISDVTGKGQFFNEYV